MKLKDIKIKTNKTSKQYSSKNATYLIQAGFIDMTMAGVYTFLPLGLRVLNKIENIVRKEMDKIGTELLMPALSPKQLWETTKRLDTVDVLMKTSGANQVSKNKSTNEYILNSTQEEVITPLVQKFNKSYKDFPFAFYQIQSKFRNEARAKSGILRGREFRMKDLYSFHTSLESLQTYYEKSKQTYTNVFNNLGLGKITKIALASGGDFTKDYSHEFQTKLEAGEDVIFYDKKTDIAYNKEVAPSKAPEFEQDQAVKEKKNIFGENITGMKALSKMLSIPEHRCIKTMIYQADEKVVAVALRGDYQVNEYKLKKALDCNYLALASLEVVKETTGANLGYAGIINLSDNIVKVFDDSIQNLVNFECGANKTNYHAVNVNWDRDVEKPSKFYDIKEAKKGDLNPSSNEVFEVYNASEVGNIFPLGTKFTKAFGYTFTTKDGQQKPVYMGSYGIGTSRVMGIIAEAFSDEKGLIWPKQVAPFRVHLININTDQEAENFYQQLQDSNIEVLFDDRDTSVGKKLTDADLIGIPTRLVMSSRNNGMIEWKDRTQEKPQLLTKQQVIEKLKGEEEL